MHQYSDMFLSILFIRLFQTPSFFVSGHFDVNLIEKFQRSREKYYYFSSIFNLHLNKVESLQISGHYLLVKNAKTKDDQHIFYFTSQFHEESSRKNNLK
jgi:hypothetical protein